MTSCLCQTHRTVYRKSAPHCNLWTLVNNNVSIWAHQLLINVPHRCHMLVRRETVEGENKEVMWGLSELPD